MIKLYLVSKTKEFSAESLYDISTKEMTVLKGSVISSFIASGMFRSAKTVEKQRKSSNVVNRKLVDDIKFKSASAAANFVTGRSTNGLIAWKTDSGMTLKELLEHND